MTVRSRPAQPLLEVRALGCERGGRLLFRDLEFSLEAGQVLQVRGGNGSGKTTLLRIICGLNDGYTGELRWRGAAIAGRRDEFHAELLYLGHRVAVNRVLTPLENLRWSCRLRGRADDGRIRSALAEMGLGGYEDSPCHALSAGQYQRVALAGLLLAKAGLWVLDEPFTTLDTGGVALLEQLVAEHAENGGAVLITTHHRLSLPGLRALTLGVSR
ncbi:MAG: cytochrome c biogenesis heme-transporting ATPase CcmA [Gammaproteobacteria bacterium]|nr:cytochrome c biogenesis heme-transporting ATPase CcmA [Gammaproteobacteria bacterium]